MGHPHVTPPLDEIQARLSELMLRDQRRLRRRIDGARKIRKPEAQRAVAAEIAADVDAAEQRVASRRAAVPEIGYPAVLPVSQRKDDIAAAIRDHQVVIVAGETGSGKTTQLPKICLELGRGVHGQIGHTQPRRLAARTVAERIAEELEVPLGGSVGYKIRFTDKSSDDTLVKLMTDGILLTELQRDRALRQYDTLIIDEAHERSLNIDFILGYLRRLLPRRPDLKVIITSATIDPERFSRHFAEYGVPSPRGGSSKEREGDGSAEPYPYGQRSDGRGEPLPDGQHGDGGVESPPDGRHGGDAPVLEVSGRTYPVEVRYRPTVDPDAGDGSGGEGSTRGGPRGTGDDGDQTQAIRAAVEELSAEGPGDILVFLSGEREIRDTADVLTKMKPPRDESLEVLPLYARLSAAEQHRVFQPHRGRRIVLATNVAETSLTVPGIKYVIDPGTARVSRYSRRLGVQRLPIERISQASAEQRKGRCGRTSDGICIRLYSESDFASRPEFTDPEILRTNLASVILQMTALGLGDIAAFPFVDPPDRRQVKEGVRLLEELGALDPAATDPRKRLTSMGRKLAQLPIDPRLGRMLLEAEGNGCLHEVLVIAAALSIQDPRERPAESRQAADEQHARFADENSDFLAYLNLWNYLQERQEALSSTQFRKLCKAEFLHFLRVREWQDLYSQLRQVAKSLGATVNTSPAEPQRVHYSLLAGLLSHIGLKDPEKQDYVGARGARFAIFPGSAVFKKRPRWVMAAELVETSKLWGRDVARIEPEWIEPLAGHLVQRNYSEPHWVAEQGAVLAYEKVTLYGVPIVASRKVNYGRVNPEVARGLFIRHALVQGEWETHHDFYHRNSELLAEVEELEHRARRRDIMADDETLFEFYDARVPADVVSTRHFDSWWKKARKTQPDLLDFSWSMLVGASADEVSEHDYPDRWRQQDLELSLTYQFEPGSDADGVTVHIPLAVLNRVDPEDFTWQVPGLRRELVTALIKSLPKQLRRNFVPAPDHAEAALQRLRPREEPPLTALSRELRQMTGVAVPRDAWELDRVPDHLLMTFRVVDDADRTLAEGKDLEALKAQLSREMRAAVAENADDVEQPGSRTWSFGSVPATHQQQRGGHVMQGFPALTDEGDAVALRVFDSEAQQRRAMWLGTRRLLLLNVPSPVTFIQGRLSNSAKLALSHNPHGSVAALLDDCLACAVDALIAEHGGPAWEEHGFGKLFDKVRGELSDTLADVVATVERILTAAHDVRGRLDGSDGSAEPALRPAMADMKTQLAGLVYPGFVTATARVRLGDVARYVRGMQRRLQKLPEDPRRDRERMEPVQQLWREYDEMVAELASRSPHGAAPSLPGDGAVRGAGPPEPPAELMRDGFPRAAAEPGRGAGSLETAAALARIRWMIEELRVSYFAQTLGTPYRVSEKRILRAMDELAP